MRRRGRCCSRRSLPDRCLWQAQPSGTPARAITQTSGAAHAGPCGRVTSPRRYRHVIWIRMENHSYGSIIGSRQAPYINLLAARCGLAVNYHNISHPSLPNYIAATSGLGYAQLRRFSSDCNPVPACSTRARSIFAQGETLAGLPAVHACRCHRNNAGEYAVRHNPPPYYTRLRRLRPASMCTIHNWPRPGRRPPARVLVHHAQPDQRHARRHHRRRETVPGPPNYRRSGQPANTAAAPPPYSSSGTKAKAAPAQRCASNTTDVGCHVTTIVISPSTRPGTRSARLFNHYSLLGTAEQLLRLPKLGRARSSATMTSAFNL